MRGCGRTCLTELPGDESFLFRRFIEGLAVEFPVLFSKALEQRERVVAHAGLEVEGVGDVERREFFGINTVER